ncbi:MAG: helix-turn-helix transcriptional regulator [Flavobacteriales bacterium]|nr:helix-turn-helix transcriptional regulator [Flavobacteriales bacterium]
MSDTSTFSEFIRKMRVERDEPLRVIAAAVGIDSTLLSKLERAERFPTEEQVVRFAKYFKVSLAELQGKVIADKVLTKYVNQDAAIHATQILNDRAAPYKKRKR